MANFIRDIRKDLGVPNLPFVIAETGMSGPSENHPRALSLMLAQAAVAKYKEFQGNVAFVGTKSVLPGAGGIAVRAGVPLEQQRRDLLPDRHGDGRGHEEALRQVGPQKPSGFNSIVAGSVRWVCLVELGGERLGKSAGRGPVR